MIPHNKPTLGEQEQKVASEVLASGWLSAGEQVTAFEREFCHYHGIPEGHAVAVASGSAALLLTIKTLGWSQQTIDLPVYTCSSLRHASKLNQCEVRYLDCSAQCNISIQHLSNNAVVPHMFGIPQHLTEVPGQTIEDCAQSIGSKVNNQPVGLQAKASVFSFYATKLLTSGGQGGMVMSEDKSLIDAIRDYLNFDCREDQQTRFNHQITDLQAAIGRVQLSRLNEFIDKRQMLFERYQSHGIKLMDTDAPDCITPIRFRAILETLYAPKLMTAMAEKGIKCIIPIEDWELLDVSGNYPNASYYSQNLLSLPLYPSLTLQQVDLIASSLKDCMEQLP